MSMSDRTRQIVGLPEKGSEIDSALGIRATAIKSKKVFSKAEDALLKRKDKVMESKQLTVEDDPWDLLPKEKHVNLLKPAYEPMTLINLVQTNNALAQLVDAMEVNIDGTGYDIERKDGETPESGEKDSAIKGIKQFFDCANLTESFTSIRRKLRRDLESVGHAYLEVIRNQAGEITLVNHLDAKLVRLVKMDDPVIVEKQIERANGTQTVKMYVRERRYAQMIGTKVKYFRDFASSRDINADTGEWIKRTKQYMTSLRPEADLRDEKRPKPQAEEGAEQGKVAPVAKFNETLQSYDAGPTYEQDPTNREGQAPSNVELGNEIIAFRCKPDVITPYGIPRWINQVPSVLGSRKAEEVNLEYFYHGGLPPLMMIIQGGQLSKQSKDLMNKYLGGEAKSKMRAVIAEVYSTSGDLSSNSAVKVQVERFGGDRLSDSMFENYDDKCSARIRSSFRLPPLFVGSAQDYSFATAYASYIVAEAQVFKPERELFDEIINNTIMKELAPDYVYRSLPLTVHDVAVQLQALTLAKDVVDRETFVDEVNEVSGLNLTMQDPLTDPMNPLNNPELNPFGAVQPGVADGDEEDEEGEEKPAFGMDGQPAKPNGKKPPPFAQKGAAAKRGVAQAQKKPNPFQKSERGLVYKDETIIQIAEEWASHLSGDKVFSPATVNVMKSMIGQLNPQVRKLFNAYVGMKLAPGAKYDPDGVSDLMACAADALHNH